jgi:hypothetical protein
MKNPEMKNQKNQTPANQTPAKPAPKSGKKDSKKTAPAPKVKMVDRRKALMKDIKVTDSIKFETESTAVKKDASAMVLYDNAIMLTLVSKETKKASRVLEIWLHLKRNDLCIAKALFDKVTEASKDLKEYRKYIDTKAKGSKYLLKLPDDATTLKFTNLLIKAL